MGITLQPEILLFAAEDLEPARLCVYESVQEGLRGCSLDPSLCLLPVQGSGRWGQMEVEKLFLGFCFLFLGS